MNRSNPEISLLASFAVLVLWIASTVGLFVAFGG
jgi:hypothetical protein